MIYRRTSQNRQKVSELLLLLTSISISIGCAIELVSGRINRNSFVGSNSIVISPQRDFSGTSIQEVNKSSLTYTERDGLTDGPRKQKTRPVFDVAFVSDPDDGNALGSSINSMDQGYFVLPRDMKDEFKNSKTLYNLLSSVDSSRAEYQMSTSPQQEHSASMSANQWVHPATTTARPTYDQIPRPMLYADDEEFRADESGFESSTN